MAGKYKTGNRYSFIFAKNLSYGSVTIKRTGTDKKDALNDLIKLGIDPFPAETYNVNISTKEILEGYQPGSQQFMDVCLAGRIMSRRIMGNASFAEIQDQHGRIQIYIRRDEVCPGEDKTLYNTVFKKLLDIGDIIGIEGFVFVTQVGEISVHVKNFRLLAKSLHPLPVVKEKEGKIYDAFSNPDQRYRQRYLDLIVNPSVKDVFIKRTRLVDSMRNFLNSRHYLEVETPVLQPLYGGATARPFTTHHNTLDMKLYLRIANELYLKRLIVGGFEGVYEFAKDFRNEGMSRFHNPEFTQMELYVAYKDYLWMMDLVEEMIEQAAIDLTGSTVVKTGDSVIDFKRPWKRYTMYEAIREFTGIDISNMDEAGMTATARSLGIEIDETMARGKLIDGIFGEMCEPNLDTAYFYNRLSG
jgi:lysyl-tRNA synthetase, class II